MAKCPICSEKLNEHDDNNWICNECDEMVPKEFAKESKIPCCDPFTKCK